MPLKIRQLSPALAMAALLIAVPAAGRASADTTASLPQLTGFHQIVVDEAAGYVFLSEGISNQEFDYNYTSTGPLIVTDLAGNYLATVDNGDGVEGMALSPDGKTLWVALAATHAVEAIDVSTITQPTPTYTDYGMAYSETPVDVALEGGKVWVSEVVPYPTGVNGHGGAIADIDPSASPPGYGGGLPEPTPSPWSIAPQIAGDPAGSGVLVAAQSGVKAASYNVSGSSPTMTAETDSLRNCQFLSDLAVFPSTPGVAHFITGCSDQGWSTTYNAADLSYLNSYLALLGSTSLFGSADAVATAADGTVAAGASSTSGSSWVSVYNASGSLLNTFPITGELATCGLALSADASRLYAVVKNGSSYSLDVFDNPKLDPSTLTLDAPNKIAIGGTYTLSGNLSLAVNTLPAGTPVQITATKPGTSARHWTVQTAANGTFTLSDKPPAAGTYTYTATYAGTSTTSSASATAKVTVTKLPVSLQIATSPNDIRYNGTVKVTAHLGKTHSNRIVSIYTQTVGSTKKVLLTRGHVNSGGYLTVKYYRAPHSEVFSAVFGGDPYYMAKTVSRTVGVHVKIAAKTTGYYATKHTGGITFHLYHHTARLNTAVTVTPNKHGQCVKLQIQEYNNHSWHASTTTNCGYLNKYSETSSHLPLAKTAQNHEYRIRADYLRKNSDQSNLNTQSSWFYYTVLK